MQTKFNFTSGGEFKDPYNRNYVGFFNVDSDGNAYSERYFNNSSVKLTPIENISTAFTLSKFFKDRIVFDTFSFPNSLETLLVETNELVCNKVLNFKLKLIDENLMYLYGRLFSADMDIPDSTPYVMLPNEVYFGTNKSIQWRLLTNSIADNERTLIPKYEQIEQIKKFVVIPFTRKDGYAIFGISNTHFISFKTFIEGGILKKSEVFIYQQVIDNNTSQKCFNLEDITYDGEHIYVTDSKINDGGQVFKYNVLSHTGNDVVYENKRFLMEAIGGYGIAAKSNKFNGCTTLGSKERELWIFDEGNECIKIYFDTFVWKKTVNLYNSTHTYKISCIKYRKLTNQVYCLFKRTNKETKLVEYGFLIYDENYSLNRMEIFEDTLYYKTKSDLFDENGEEINNSDLESFSRFDFSTLDSNVVYVITEVNIHKKFLTNTKKSFAIFNRGLIFLDSPTLSGPIKFVARDISIIESNSNIEGIDNVFILANNSILQFKEKCDYISLLHNKDLNYNPYKDIILDKNEYVQSFVLNKEFYKIYSNLLQIKNNLKGKLEYFFNNYGDVAGNDTRYFYDEEINELNLELDYNLYFNDNELIDPNVINRHLIKIYSFMDKMLFLTKDSVLNNRVTNLVNSPIPIPFYNSPKNRIGNDDIYVIE